MPWDWPHKDAIRPLLHRCWIFPNDPDLVLEFGRMKIKPNSYDGRIEPHNPWPRSPPEEYVTELMKRPVEAMGTPKIIED